MTFPNDPLSEFAVKHVGTLVLHPLGYARTLMQLGYEPDPPHLSHTVFSLIGIGKKIHRYPNVFHYLARVKDELGGWWYVWTTGFCAKVTGNLIKDGVAKVFDIQCVSKNGCIKNDADCRSIKDILQYCCIASVGHTIGLVVSYPLHSVMVHQMAAALGHDPLFRGHIIQVFREIVDKEGVLGLFNGLQAAILGDLAALWGTTVLAYFLRRYVLTDNVAQDIQQASPLLASFIVTSYTYRYGVVSTVMCVSQAGLMLSTPFGTSKEAWQNLSLRGEMNRGSSLFLRTAPVKNVL